MSEIQTFAPVVYVPDDLLISEVVKIMVDKSISSVLVHDKKNQVVGILTERDIVRKFTLLPIADKMNRTVATVMTRGVHFIHPGKIEPQIIELHLKERIRHFPILGGDEPLVENVMGILSITDFLRQYLLVRYKKETKKQVEEEIQKIPLGILAPQKSYGEYQGIFSSLGFRIFQIQDLNHAQTQNIIFDIDGFDQNFLKNQIPIAKKLPGHLAFITANPTLINPFRRSLKPSHQAISLKPLDISYLCWFFSKEHKIIEKEEEKALI